MRRLLILGAVWAATVAAPAVADETAAMRAAAGGFYGVYQALHPSGLPGDADRAKFAPFLSPGLEGLLRQGAAAEARFVAAHKGAPPLVEGDLFTSLFEGASAVTVGACAAAGPGGQCAVTLSYSDGTSKQAWTDTVYLVNTPGGWRVDDIGYGGGWDFGNKGRLSQVLKQVIGFP
ncbi:MAG TPA: hypothetical protein VGC36_12015 [Rhizomicrobium sp.]